MVYQASQYYRQAALRSCAHYLEIKVRKTEIDVATFFSRAACLIFPTIALYIPCVFKEREQGGDRNLLICDKKLILLPIYPICETSITHNSFESCVFEELSFDATFITRIRLKAQDSLFILTFSEFIQVIFICNRN